MIRDVCLAELRHLVIREEAHPAKSTAAAGRVAATGSPLAAGAAKWRGLA